MKFLTEARLRQCRRGLEVLKREESAQILPLVAVLMIGLLGMCAFSIDVGDCYYSFRQLQASTDAAALAGAWALPSTTAATNAIAYSGVAGGMNYYPHLSTVSMVSGYPKLECLTTLVNQGVACTAPANANAVQVKQQVSVPMYFAMLFGTKTVSMTATSTASTRGANPKPYNVAIIVDTTLSMNYSDNDCGNTQIGCALNGVQQLLQTLSPCGITQKTCTITNGTAANSVDRVSLFTFPVVTTATVSNDTNCNTATATAAVYAFPTVGATSYSPSGSTYQVTSYQSDYKTSDTATTLNASSNLSIASGAGGSGCAGLGPPSNAGNYGTYYAGVIYAAQSSLLAQQAANPGSQNIMILLSDGNATADGNINPSTGQIYNTPPQYLGSFENYKNNTVPMFASNVNGTGIYPSYAGECGQAVVAANLATAQGTTVYSVAYGSEPTGCISDSDAFFKAFNQKNLSSYPNITPCQTMAAIASTPANFYSDYNQTGSNSTCVAAANSTTKINDIFQQIGNGLTVARLIPDGTT